MEWRPKLGAWLAGDGTWFRVWAPAAGRVEVILYKKPSEMMAHELQAEDQGVFSGFLSGVAAGDRYAYRLDGQGPYPDPASRFQPDGVHGPSVVVNPHQFRWSDRNWRGIPLEDLVVYELHVGTFTPEGTFAGVRQRLSYLADLGITAVELMPVADFPGRRNWGYDGVDLFAPARCYGEPDDLRELVDEAHRLGLAVILDVVYNHLGPDGNYLGAYSPYYFSSQYQTGWGAGLNFDGPQSEHVRGFFIENARHWIHEYHFDGLRLDATHAITDQSPRHFLAELAAGVRESVPDRSILVIAEDHRNLAGMMRPESEGGWLLDAVWADGFHHQMRRLLAGDNEGYFSDFTGTSQDLATTIRHGWFYCGQYSQHLGEPRGTDPTGVRHPQFVYCLQNHDQVGNRALGERLHHQIDAAAYRAATTLLLCCPATPLIFMGQEWSATTPFLYFTDHHPELGKLVTEGRRQEFRHFSAFTDPKARLRIPDPQADATFNACKLVWKELKVEKHACMFRLYQQLLRLRRRELTVETAGRVDFEVAAVDEDTLLIQRTANTGRLLVIARLRGKGEIDLAPHLLQAVPGRTWELVLTTEDPPFCPDPKPPQIARLEAAPTIGFLRPSAAILRETFPMPKSS